MVSQVPGVGAKKTTIAVFIAVMIGVVSIVGIVSYSYPPSGVTSSGVSTTTAEQISTFYSTVSSQGLRLQVQLNASSFGSGSALAAEVSVFNSLDANVSLSLSYPANSTISSWNDYDFFCGNSGSPLRAMLGYALFSGDYSAANFSLAGGPLQLAPPVGISCVTEEEPSSIVFLPDNDTTVFLAPGNPGGIAEAVTLEASTESCTNPSPGTYYCGSSKGLSGYWNTAGVSILEPQEAAIGSQYFDYFPPDEYTLAVQDIWGQSLFAHFRVTAQTSTASSSLTTSISTDSALVAECPEIVPGADFGTVTAGAASPALLCVQLYYYSDTPLTINLTSALSVQALQYIFSNGVGVPRSFSGAPNFTISASQSELTIGGPSNENEGAIVAYAVTAHSGASGTYPIGLLLASGLSAWMFGAGEPESCSSYGQLVAGNGQPNYNQGIGSCITYATRSESSNSSSEFSVPGVPYQLIKGDLYFALYGASSPAG